MTLRLICFFILIVVIVDAQLTNCPTNQINFKKILGIKPSNDNHPLFLLKGNQNATTECIDKCKSNPQCRSFIIYFNISTCYWYQNAIEGVQERQLEADTNVAWFVKVCLQVSNCTKLWIFEIVPGATLVGNDTKILPKTQTRTECQQNCLNEKTFDCKSTKFRIRNSDYGPNDDIKGTCILSDTDRHILPNAFRASGYNEEYFENQCSQTFYDNDDDEFCSYEEYENTTLLHSDLYFKNKTKEQCEELCEEIESFNCRGYSVVFNRRSPTECFLHSEDSKVYGPRLLQPQNSGTYFEKTPCLDISIICTETYMSVMYNPQLRFMGRMYMEGYSEHPECSVKGAGSSTVVLKLSVLSQQCGILRAVAEGNRTLVAGTMILQYNPLVQTQGDRTIRIGCVYGNNTKALVGTGITITSAPSHSSPLLNTTGGAGSPTVEMRILDLSSQTEVSSTQIGQELQLVIEIKPAGTPLDIWAGHLVAMTENSEESILLLDDRGCPTNLNIFPSLRKIVTKDTKKLVANFQAFKFSSSPIVRFSVIVQFCAETCPSVDCGNNVESFGRTKRQLQPRYLQTVNGTKIINVNRSDFEKHNKMELPLEFIMIVRSSGSNSERLVLGDGRILVAGYDYIRNEVCLDYSLFLGLIITWVLIQVILVTCCIVMVRRFRKYYEHESTRQSLEQLHKNFGIGFSNLENRRVHWADNGDYT